jgi:hypothetical protein
MTRKAAKILKTFYFRYQVNMKKKMKNTQQEGKVPACLLSNNNDYVNALKEKNKSLKKKKV